MHWSVVGHDQQRQHLERLFNEGALAHAYLFAGPRGIGKRMIAADLAAALLMDGGPALEHNPDFTLLAPGVNKDTGKQTDIPVDDARAMKNWAYQKPLYGTRKVVIVDDADLLGEAAANTLLKVLEEPPDYLSFMLTTAVSGAVLPTITSRCQVVAFRPLSEGDMSKVLKGTHIDDDGRKLLQAVAAGKPGIAHRLIGDGRLTEIAQSVALFEKLLKSGMAERLVAAKTIADDDALPEVVSWWLSWVHAQLDVRPQLAPAAQGLLELSGATRETKFNRRLALDRFLLGLVP